MVEPYITEYRFGNEEDDRNHRAIFVEHRSNHQFCITNKCGDVYNNLKEWEWEPSPSNRDDEFISRTRYNVSDALFIANELYEKSKGNVI